MSLRLWEWEHLRWFFLTVGLGVPGLLVYSWARVVPR